jgi:hypothetical protein
MHRGSSWRPPRRTAFAGRLGLLMCLLVLAGHIAQKKDCGPEPPRTTRRGNADPMSFVFFMGILVAFVAVPLALSRREELSRE